MDLEIGPTHKLARELHGGFERFGFFAPRHYLEQFHPRHNSEVKGYAFFEGKAFDFNIERPAMTAWTITDYEAATIGETDAAADDKHFVSCHFATELEFVGVEEPVTA